MKLNIFVINICFSYVTRRFVAGNEDVPLHRVGLNILLSVSGNRIHQDKEMSLASDHIQEDLIHHDGKQGTFNV